MPILFAVTPSTTPTGPALPTGGYCSLAEARALGAKGDDDTVGAAIEMASREAEDKTGRHWPTPSTKTVTARRNEALDVLVKDTVSSVTGVTIDGAPLTADRYEVHSWGIRLLAAPAYDTWAYGGPAAPDRYPLERPRNRLPRPVDVVVTCTVGTDLPPSWVRRLVALLAADYTQPVERRDPSLTGLTVEGYARTWATPDPNSTGNAEADRIIKAHRRPMVG